MELFNLLFYSLSTRPSPQRGRFKHSQVTSVEQYGPGVYALIKQLASTHYPCTYSKPDRARVSTSTFTHKIDKRVDLTYPVGLETEEAPEEVVLRVQGFVIWADLPPIHSYQRCVIFQSIPGTFNICRLPRNVLSAKQAIRLTGLGREAFDACAVAILEIQQILSGQLPPNSLQRYQPGTEQGYLTLEFANRYFTVSNNSDDQEVPMNTYIDPVSVLRERVPANAKHTADNEVLYFEKRTTTR